MRRLRVSEVLRVHRKIVDQTGGTHGVRDTGALEASVRLPFATFAGEELYPSLIEKAAAICFALVSNHPFVDGNKRIAHAAMELTLALNEWWIDTTIDQQEELMLSLAAGEFTRDDLLEWLERHAKPVTMTEE